MSTNVNTQFEIFSDDSKRLLCNKAEVGVTVKIKKIDKESKNLEDYYYLKRFENKKGKIIERLNCSTGIYSYHIEFENQVYGYFYQEDFVLVNEDD